MTYITLDGAAYAVSPQFGAAIQHVLGTMTFDTKQVEADRLNIMARSNERALLHIETERLAYLTHVKNVANAIRVVGAHHDPVKEWGFDGWDAVHGNRLKKHCGCEKHGEACAAQPREDCDKPYGCEHHFVFDHHSATNNFGHNRVTDIGNAADQRQERKHHEIAHYPCKAHG